MGAAEETKTEPPSLRQILEKAGASAVRGGTAGAVAMGMNVGLLMWMRTTVRLGRKIIRRDPKNGVVFSDR